MIVLYAVATAPWREQRHARAVGLERAPLGSRRCGALHAVVSEHASAPARDVDAVTAHARVVIEVGHHLEVAPVRFGSWHADAASLCANLAAAEARLLALVDHLGGRVEFVVRPAEPRAAVGRAPSSPERVGARDAGEGTGEGHGARDVVDATGSATAASGRRYLERRLAADRSWRGEVADLGARLRRATSHLEPLARDHRSLRGRAGPERCFLVDRDRAGTFADEAAELSADGAWIVGGPWPPFTFAALPVPTASADAVETP